MRTNMSDAGHGGKDSGAIGINKVNEKDIVLDVNNLVDKYLKTQDMKNVNTRTTDTFVSLNDRSDKANSLGVNSFVSIHCNESDDPQAHGLEIFCYKFKYRELADCILSELKADNLYTRLREGGVKEKNLHVVRETNMPACLIELGFISNREDYNLIMNNKDRFAKAIAKGICKFNGVAWKESGSPAEGFVNGDYSGRKARVTADVLNVRWDRGTEYDVIGQVKNGAIVNLQYCLNNWVSIEGFKGSKGLGYVSTKYLELV